MTSFVTVLLRKKARSDDVALNVHCWRIIVAAISDLADGAAVKLADDYS